MLRKGEARGKHRHIMLKLFIRYCCYSVHMEQVRIYLRDLTLTTKKILSQMPKKHFTVH